MTNTTDLSDRQSPPTLRVALLDEEEALSRGRALGIDDYICKMNLFRVLLRHPELARQVNGTIMSLVGGNKVLSAKRPQEEMRGHANRSGVESDRPDRD